MLCFQTYFKRENSFLPPTLPHHKHTCCNGDSSQNQYNSLFWNSPWRECARKRLRELPVPSRPSDRQAQRTLEALVGRRSDRQRHLGSDRPSQRWECPISVLLPSDATSAVWRVLEKACLILMGKASCPLIQIRTAMCDQRMAQPHGWRRLTRGRREESGML